MTLCRKVIIISRDNVKNGKLPVCKDVALGLWFSICKFPEVLDAALELGFGLQIAFVSFTNIVIFLAH